MEGWGWQRVHDPAALPGVLERWRQSLATGEPFEMAFPLRGADGSFRLFLTRVQPSHGSGGEVSRWFGTNTDIEAQRQAMAERDAALASANEANRAKDEFLAMLGHELRNPLSPIVTALKLLEMRDGRSREYAVIDRQVSHLSRLVDDLLDVARFAQGKVELRRAPVEISTAVRSAVEMASPLLEQAGQRVTVDVAPTGLLVSADVDRLAQVISNLLTNACKFSDPASDIVVRGERDSDVVRIRVRDRGVGIAPEMLDRIFQSFVQHRQAIDRASGGLGLGLSIVKNLVQLHGGNVYARSDGPGRGSEFVVELSALPMAVDAQGSSPDASVTAGLGAGDDTCRGRVLVVDDNQDAADMLAAYLRGVGFDVRVANDPVLALEAARDFRPEYALLDIGLPVMDGWELGRRLRELRRDGSPTLIAVTGYGQDSDRRRSQENGFAGHLNKPVDLDALSKLVCG